MNRGRLALVGGPELDYCTAYHCAGDCGQPHNDKERAAYAAHALATFDALQHADKRAEREQRAEVQRKSRNAL